MGEVRLDGTALELARTMANEAAMASRTRPSTSTPGAGRSRPPDRLLQPPLLPRATRRGAAPGQPQPCPISLLLLDLDQFKLVNDTFGHLLGDRVLVWTAELVRSTLRASDVPARYGGDEFAVSCLTPTASRPRSSSSGSSMPSQRARSRPSTEAWSDRLSIGVATYPTDGSTATEFIAAADRALYAVKRRNGGGAPSAQRPPPQVAAHDG